MLHYPPSPSPLSSWRAQALGALYPSLQALARFISFPVALVLCWCLPDNPHLGEAPLSLRTWTTEHSEKLMAPRFQSLLSPRIQPMELNVHMTYLLRHILAICFFTSCCYLPSQSLHNSGDLRPIDKYKLFNLLLLVMFLQKHI